MNFISKLYFNMFKQIGNLRFMFVISCLFGIISLTMVSFEALDRVYFYRVHTPLKPWEYYTLQSAIESSTRFSDEDLESIFQLLALRDCRRGDIARAEQRYLSHDGEQGCKKLADKYQNEKISIYSFAYIWNYLWAIFWFYFPFLIVLPIKFVVDGYQQDKRKKK